MRHWLYFVWQLLRIFATSLALMLLVPMMMAGKWASRRANAAMRGNRYQMRLAQRRMTLSIRRDRDQASDDERKAVLRHEDTNR